MLQTRRQGKTRVEAVASLCGANTPLAPFETLREVSRETRREILREALSPSTSREVVEALPEELQLFSLVLHLWTKSSSVSLTMVEAVVMCRLVLSRVDPVVGGERSSKKLENLLLKCDDSKQSHFYKCALDLSPAFHIQEGMKSNPKKFDPLAVHSFSVLQAITYASLALNKLLGNVFVFPRICDLFNGTFIYNLSNVMQHLNKKSLLPCGVEEEFSQNLDSVMTVVKDATEKVSKLSGKKKKSKLNVRGHGQEGGEVFDNSESYQDLGNRFSALSFN